ncbi:hypothetical protein ACLB1E_15600 [Escherichia coli]
MPLTLRLAWRWKQVLPIYRYKYVGLKGAIVGMTGYGESAPADSCSRSLALPPRILWQKRIRCWE